MNWKPGPISTTFSSPKNSQETHRQKTRMDIKTIRHALKKNTFSQGRATPRGSKLDAFKDQIQDLLKKYPGLSGVRICQEIKKTGYAGGSAFCTTTCEPSAPPPKPSCTSKPSRRRRPSGLGLCRHHPDRAYPQKAYCFLLALSFSSLLYLEFFPSQSLENFLTGHLHAFHFLQGFQEDPIR